jgi:hypothetical protein
MTIDVNGDVDFLHDRIGPLAEPAPPHLVAHDIPLLNGLLVNCLTRPLQTPYAPALNSRI